VRPTTVRRGARAAITQHRVMPTEALLSELRELFGSEHVRLVRA
jgi:hypothetical protein